MNWVIYAAIAAAALAAADVLVKATSGKVSNALGMLLYGIVPFLVGLFWFLSKAKSEQAVVAPMGILYGLGVGVMFTTVTFGMYAAFAAGAPISLASPLIRVGGLLLASVAGVLIWKEPLTGRYVLGLCLTLAGMFLMMKR